MQETPASKGGTHQYVFFDSNVFLQTAVNRIPAGSAIFFEFKHWKEKEKKVGQQALVFAWGKGMEQKVGQHFLFEFKHWKEKEKKVGQQALCVKH